jgi:hypothetical protein
VAVGSLRRGRGDGRRTLGHARRRPFCELWRRRPARAPGEDATRAEFEGCVRRVDVLDGSYLCVIVIACCGWQGGCGVAGQLVSWKSTLSTDTRSDASSVLWVIVSGGRAKVVAGALAVHQDGLSQGPGCVQTAPGPAGPRLIPLGVGRRRGGRRERKGTGVVGRARLRPVEFDIWTWPHRHLPGRHSVWCAS